MAGQADPMDGSWRTSRRDTSCVALEDERPDSGGVVWIFDSLFVFLLAPFVRLLEGKASPYPFPWSST